MTRPEEKLKKKVIRALEKREEKKTPKWMKVLPAIGGGVGTAYALKRPGSFLPIAKGGGNLKAKAIAAALGAGAGATLGWLPQVFNDATQALKK